MKLAFRNHSGFFAEQQLTSTPETGNKRDYEKNGKTTYIGGSARILCGR